jgi:hypothetical protein
MPPFKSPFSISFVDASIAAFLTHAERALARRAQKNEVLGAQQSAKQLFHTHRMSLRTVRGSESASKTVLLQFAGGGGACNFARHHGTWLHVFCVICVFCYHVLDNIGSELTCGHEWSLIVIVVCQ